jgi:hypothetical protein
MIQTLEKKFIKTVGENGKGEDTFHPRTSHEGLKGEKGYNFTFS